MPYKDPNSDAAKASAARRKQRYRQTEKGKETERTHRRQWQKTDKGREWKQRSNAVEQQRHRAKQQARQKLEYAVRTGRVLRPPECEGCGASCKPEGHHDDYDQALKVRWLCGPCHRSVHAVR